jgi:hypothetical protein
MESGPIEGTDDEAIVVSEDQIIAAPHSTRHDPPKFCRPQK